MKTILTTACVWMSLAIWAAADAPKQLTLTRYAKLWTDSPFTTKPVVTDTPEENPLEDYALGGISKLQDGYYAILFNRKKPEEKIVIYPGRDSQFEVLDVKWPNGSWKDAVVTVRNGRNTGVVKFEDKLLTVKVPAAAAPKNNNQRQQARGNNNQRQQNNNNNRGGRTPRPRQVVRPNNN